MTKAQFRDEIKAAFEAGWEAARRSQLKPSWERTLRFAARLTITDALNVLKSIRPRGYQETSHEHSIQR